MMTEKQSEAIIEFLVEYSEFIRAMANDEKEKLASLTDNSLERIERCILASQSNAKKLESLEKKRAALQEKNECSGFSLTELCEAAPESMRAKMRELSNAVRSGVADIKFNNDKAMSVAQMNVIQINPDAVLTTVKHDSASNPYKRAQNREHDAETASFLTKKV